MTVDLTAKLSKQSIEAQRRLERKGLYLMGRPSFDLPKLPLRLTDVDDNYLMRLLVRFVRYQDHVSGELVLAEIDERAAENALEVEKARHLAKRWTGASSDRVAVSKAEALMDAAVQGAIEKYEACHARRKMLTVLADSLARDGAVVSREISRRIGRESSERRVDRRTP